MGVTEFAEHAAMVLADTPTIAEAHFRKYVAALFDFTDNEESEKLRTEWMIQVCIDPRLPCDVVDKEGKKLFRVPPMAPPLATLLDKGISDQMTQISAASEINPFMGKAMEADFLTSDLHRMKVTQEDMQGWRTIAAYYGITPANDSGPTATSVDADGLDEPDEDDGW